MFTKTINSTRRRFLSSIASSAAALGLATVASPFQLEGKSMDAAVSPDEQSMEQWLSRIKGKHKQVFDSMQPDNGLPLAWSRIFVMTNQTVGVPESDCTSVLILRHDSIPFAMESRLWEKYKFGEFFKINDPATKAPSIRNMFWKAQGLPLPGMGIDELLAGGILIGVCEMAITVNSMRIAKEMNMSPEETKKDWISGVFPGIQIVPSGVLAVNRAQEHGCTYCWAG